MDGGYNDVLMLIHTNGHVNDMSSFDIMWHFIRLNRQENDLEFLCVIYSRGILVIVGYGAVL